MTLRLYTQLSSDSAEADKWFEALRVGTFRDMHGKNVQFGSEDLDRLVEETQKVIDASIDSSGETLGLPIDRQNHDHGEAAGWIVGIKRVGDKIMLLPKWTELGVDLIKKKIMKLFSATVDMGRMALKGGSLTNWPAVTGLKPIELSDSLVSFTLPDEPYSEAADRIRKQFYEQFPLPDWSQDQFAPPSPVSPPAWCKGVYDSYITVESDEQLYRVDMTPGENGSVTFAARDKWQPIRMVPIEMAKQTPSENEEMLITDEMKAELSAFIADAVKGAVKTEIAQAIAPATDGGDVPATDLSAIREKILADQKTQFAAELARIEEETAKNFKEYQAKVKAEQALKNFCTSVTDGSAGQAFPITADALFATLSKVDANTLKEIQGFMTQTVKSGLVEMSADGTDGNGGAEHKVELPAHVAQALRTGKLTVADLSSELVAGILDLPVDRYDLSAFATK